MVETIYPAHVSGTARAPASKSHTIRAIIIASLSRGESKVDNPLESEDTASCISTCRALGADIRESGRHTLLITGTAGQPTAAEEPIDVGNSGTTLYLAMGTAALAEGITRFTGDEQLRRRNAANLLSAFRDLGATAYSETGNGCAPLAVGNGLRGGTTSIECPTSQYLSSLLLACPRATGDSEIILPLLWERPYVDMTLWWLDRQGIRYERDEYARFHIAGNQHYEPFHTSVPGDYSSATFLFVAAAMTGGPVTVTGLRPDDPQGDKAVLDVLETMGCSVAWSAEDAVTVTGPGHGRLSGGTFDLNATPDALPALAVAGAACEHPLHLTNVPQARQKETDRIAVMKRELSAVGLDIEEHDDGLTVHPGRIHGGLVAGHGDHRVVMAMATAGLSADTAVSVDTAERAAITFPGFFDTIRTLAGQEPAASRSL